MNTFQIYKVLKKDLKTREYFSGVFARDQLPTKVKWPSCMVINTDKSNEPGEHWLAVYYDKDGNCDFFDSYGNSPSKFNLKKYFETTSISINYNNKKIQGFFSDYCGHYCLIFLYLRCRGKSLESIENLFNNSSDTNDNLIKKLIKEFE